METALPIEVGWSSTKTPGVYGKQGKSKTNHLVVSNPWLELNKRGIRMCNDTQVAIYVLYKGSPLEICAKCRNLAKHKINKFKARLDYDQPILENEMAYMLSWHWFEHIISPLISFKVAKYDINSFLSSLHSPTTREMAIVVRLYHQIAKYNMSRMEEQNITSILAPFQKDRWGGPEFRFNIPAHLTNNRHEALTWITSLEVPQKLYDYIKVCNTINDIFNAPVKPESEAEEELLAASVALKLGVFTTE